MSCVDPHCDKGMGLSPRGDSDMWEWITGVNKATRVNLMAFRESINDPVSQCLNVALMCLTQQIRQTSK